MSTPYIKLKQPLHEHTLLCRGCLAESGEMKNMREWGLAEDFYRIAEVPKRDNVLELLCASCEDILLRCRGFKQRCQESDAFLQDTAKKKSEETFEPSNTITCLLKENKLNIIITASDMDAKILLPCPYETGNNCSEKYLKKRYLHNHLIKSHNMSQNLVIECQYFCTYPDCSYFVNANKKFFNERKYLNQHYNKVHRAKVTCVQCNMSFSDLEFERHLKVCNITYVCQICNIEYKNNERLLVHLMRKHPEIHEQYKRGRKKKRTVETVTECKRIRVEDKLDYICDSPKRSLATQTRPEENIKNDVTLPSWKTDTEAKTDEISTQTVFEDLLSLKSQTSDDEFLETVSLSDIQTQTFPMEFGLTRSHKETKTSETQSPDLSIKETQTCFCLYDSPKPNIKLFDSVSSNPLSINLTSTETQTAEFKFDNNELLSFHSTETQTCFEEELSKESL